MDKKWDNINRKLKLKDPAFEEPDVPFKPTNVIKDFNFLYAKIYDKEKFIAA